MMPIVRAPKPLVYRRSQPILSGLPDTRLMRAKTIVALGLAAAVSGGVTIRWHSPAAADTLPHRLAVPGLAVDAGPAPVVSAGHISARNDGGLVVTGDVTNGSGVAVASVRLLVHATVAGQPLTRETTALVSRLAPGGVSPFSVRFALPGETATGLNVEVLAYDQTDAVPTASFAFSGPYPFQVGPPDPKTGTIPYSTILEQLRGQVTNQSSRPLQSIDIVVAMYDGDGNVAWVGNGAELQVPFEVAGGVQQLEDGQTGTFIVGIPIGLLGSISGHATIRGFLNASIQ